MPRDGALRLLTHPFRNGQRVAHTDTNDLENLLDRFDIAFDDGLDLVWGRWNVAHLQCACKGAQQSSPDGSHHVIEGGRDVLLGLNSVKRLDPTVHAEPDRCIKPFQECLPCRSVDAFNPRPTGMNNFSHIAPLPFFRRGLLPRTPPPSLAGALRPAPCAA